MLVLSSACTGKDTVDGTETITRTDTVMGTVAQLTFYGNVGEDAQRQQECAESVVKMLHDLENNMLSSKLEDSEVSRLNIWNTGTGLQVHSQQEDTWNTGTGLQVQSNQEEPWNTETGLQLTPELEEILQTCLQVSEDSEGAFDITIGALCRLWNMDEVAQGRAQAVIPDQAQIREALSHTGYHKLKIHDHGVYLEDGILLELGSIGKGYALDRIRETLAEEGRDTLFQGGVVALGGSILTFGEKADKAPWKVGIKDPSDPSGIIGYLRLEGEWYVSTSGDYERYFEMEGRRYSHLLDPSTGYPVDNELASVTILAKNGLLSDALSTACFVMGEEGAKRLAEQYDVMIVLVTKQGEIWYSPDLPLVF